MAFSISPRKMFPPQGHDHKKCVKEALRKAEEICRLKGARLTAIRRNVLEIVWESHTPIGAYDILERLNKGGGRNAPITVYRALEFLMEHLLIHRLESLNAYTGCEWVGSPHGAHFLICNICGSVGELPDNKIDRVISRSAAQAGFAVDSAVVEVRGLCPDCRSRSTS